MNRGPNIAIEKLCWDLYELLFLKQHSFLIAIIHWESNMNLLQSKNYVVSDTKVFSKTIPELISFFSLIKMRMWLSVSFCLVILITCIQCQSHPDEIPNFCNLKPILKDKCTLVRLFKKLKEEVSLFGQEVLVEIIL